MNDLENTQPLLPCSEKEEMQEVEVGEEQLEEVNGGTRPIGVLMTPGRGILQRSDSAPGRLQGNHYITPPASPAHSASPSGSASPAWSGWSSFSAGSLEEFSRNHTRPVAPASRSHTPSPEH